MDVFHRRNTTPATVPVQFFFFHFKWGQLSAWGKVELNCGLKLCFTAPDSWGSRWITRWHTIALIPQAVGGSGSRRYSRRPFEVRILKHLHLSARLCAEVNCDSAGGFSCLWCHDSGEKTTQRSHHCRWGTVRVWRRKNVLQISLCIEYRTSSRSPVVRALPLLC